MGSLSLDSYLLSKVCALTCAFPGNSSTHVKSTGPQKLTTKPM